MTLIEPPDLKIRLQNKLPTLFAHWHGDEIVLLSLIGKYRIATITSTSKDGEIMDALVKFVGGVTSRGSSTRGAIAALKGLVKLIKSGRNSSFAVDGPKGPVYKVKPGVFEVSRLVQSPIYYCGVSCDRAWRFEKSWNKTFFPKPFAKIIIEWAGYLPAISSDQDPRSESLALSLENALHKSRDGAFKKIAAPSV